MQLLKSINIKVFFVVLTVCSFFSVAEKQQFNLAHIDKSIDIDGQLNEPHWQQATLVALKYQNEPNEKGTPPVKTDA